MSISSAPKVGLKVQCQVLFHPHQVDPKSPIHQLEILEHQRHHSLLVLVDWIVEVKVGQEVKEVRWNVEVALKEREGLNIAKVGEPRQVVRHRMKGRGVVGITTWNFSTEANIQARSLWSRFFRAIVHSFFIIIIIIIISLLNVSLVEATQVNESSDATGFQRRNSLTSYLQATN